MNMEENQYFPLRSEHNDELRWERENLNLGIKLYFLKHIDLNIHMMFLFVNSKKTSAIFQENNYHVDANCLPYHM